MAATRTRDSTTVSNPAHATTRQNCTADTADGSHTWSVSVTFPVASPSRQTWR